MAYTTQYIGSRYVPLFAEPAEWDSTRTYEPLTIVMHDGNSYTSRQYVPVGIKITNEKFWALTGNYNAQVEAYRKEVRDILPLDETPTEGSIKGVTSDGIKKAIDSAVSVETDRAKAAEQTNADAIASETTRATNAEKANADAITANSTAIALNTAMLAGTTDSGLKTLIDADANNIITSRRITAQHAMQKLFSKYKFIGHQGALYSAPGNTIPSFQIAINSGYKILECDVQKTSDNVLVLSHSNDLSEATAATGNISNTTYNNLMNINITKGYHASDYSNLHMPTLEEYLKLCNANGCIPFVEDKIYDPVTIAKTCIETIGYNWCYMGPIYACQEVINTYPDVACCAVIVAPTEEDFDNAANNNLIGIHVGANNITQSLVDYAHSKQLLIGAFNTSVQNYIYNELTYGVDFINIDNTTFSVVFNSSNYDIGSYKVKGVPFVTPQMEKMAKDGSFGINGNVLPEWVDFDNNTISYADTWGFSSGLVLDFNFTNVNVLPVQVKTLNGKYRYFIRNFAKIDDTTTNMKASPWLTEDDIYYLSCARDYTKVGSNVFVLSGGNADNTWIGDIDVYNMANATAILENDNICNYLSTYVPSNKVYVSNAFYLKPITTTQGMTYDYDASDSDGTSATQRYRIHELNSSFTIIRTSSWLTETGTYTVYNANAAYLMIEFQQQTANTPLKRSTILKFCPAYNIALSIM